MPIQEQILHAVLADASSKLTRALAKRDYYKAEQAIQTVVEAALPERRVMPERVIGTIYRKTPGPHIAWKWITATGVNVLLVHASIIEWGKIEVSALLTYPGLSKKERLLFRDETRDVANIPILVKQAVNQMESYYL